MDTFDTRNNYRSLGELLHRGEQHPGGANSLKGGEGASPKKPYAARQLNSGTGERPDPRPKEEWSLEYAKFDDRTLKEGAPYLDDSCWSSCPWYEWGLAPRGSSHRAPLRPTAPLPF
jgi:hypothetical protein